MPQYNHHPIYGFGARGSGKEWSCKGLIFDSDDKVTTIKSLEPTEVTFATRKKAEDHALKLCKNWIDEQKAAIESTSRAPSAPLKADASVM